jgi:hypothetical protein
MNLAIILYSHKYGTDVILAKTAHPAVSRAKMAFGATPDTLPPIDNHLLRKLGVSDPNLGEYEWAEYYEILASDQIDNEADLDAIRAKPKLVFDLTEDEWNRTYQLLNDTDENLKRDSVVWEKWFELPDRVVALDSQVRIHTYAIVVEIVSPTQPGDESCWVQAHLFERFSGDSSEEAGRYVNREDGEWSMIGTSDVSESIHGDWEFPEAVLVIQGSHE